MTLRWQSRDLTKNTAQRSDASYQIARLPVARAILGTPMGWSIHH